VVSINGVQCPVCKERLTGENPEELSEKLRMHMADLHQMRELSTPTNVGAGTSRVSYTGPETRAERDVTSFGGESDRYRGAGASVQREEVTRFRDTGRMESPEEQEVTRFNRNDPYEQDRLQQEASQWRSPPSMESKTERQVTTFSGREPSMESEERRLRSEEVGEWKYPRTGEQGERGPISEVRHGGGVGHRMTHYRREMTMMLECPICGRPVYGSDDEDLSDELRFHFKDEHNIRRR
jgi:predicted small metal-binding protein